MTHIVSKVVNNILSKVSRTSFDCYLNWECLIILRLKLKTTRDQGLKNCNVTSRLCEA